MLVLGVIHNMSINYLFSRGLHSLRASDTQQSYQSPSNCREGPVQQHMYCFNTEITKTKIGFNWFVTVHFVQSPDAVVFKLIQLYTNEPVGSGLSILYHFLSCFFQDTLNWTYQTILETI